MKVFLLFIVAVAFAACDRNEVPMGNVQDRDNTGVNVRDRDMTTMTPINQSESEGDRRISQRIREALMSDGQLSTNAKNIKIITVNGVVTLRGPVLNDAEKESIRKKAQSIQGVQRVDNQLEITNRNQ